MDIICKGDPFYNPQVIKVIRRGQGVTYESPWDGEKNRHHGWRRGLSGTGTEGVKSREGVEKRVQGETVEFEKHLGD